ncbi:MAG TPA: helix-hairpin-helix domain-containing protein [Desulfosporosinus sp.]|nr:helix-hairpin-helix domain-containing protein [Desulfosporosinus sp.]
MPGVGPALAERILQYRAEHGPFARPEAVCRFITSSTRTAPAL